MNRLQLVLSATLAAAVAALLAGCVPESAQPTTTSSTAQDPKKSESSSSSQSSQPSPTKSPSGQEPSLESEKFDANCESLFPADKLYQFDSNLAVISSDKAISSSTTDQQATLKGLFCDLVHLSSGSSVQYGFVKLTTASADRQVKRINSSPDQTKFPVTSSIAGAFTSPSGQFVSNQIWVTISSTEFTNPTDVSAWANLVVGSLPR